TYLDPPSGNRRIGRMDHPRTSKSRNLIHPRYRNRIGLHCASAPETFTTCYRRCHRCAKRSPNDRPFKRGKTTTLRKLYCSRYFGMGQFYAAASTIRYYREQPTLYYTSRTKRNAPKRIAL